MSHTILLEDASERIADSVHKASRVTTAVADAIEDGVAAAKRVARQSGDAAEDFVNDSRRRIRQNPLTMAAAMLTAGFAVGLLAGCLVKRR